MQDLWISIDQFVLPLGLSGKESTCNAGATGSSWVGNIPWSRAWQPTPVFLPGESPQTEEPGGRQSIGSQRVRHDSRDLACMDA